MLNLVNAKFSLSTAALIPTIKTMHRDNATTADRHQLEAKVMENVQSPDYNTVMKLGFVLIKSGLLNEANRTQLLLSGLQLVEHAHQSLDGDEFSSGEMKLLARGHSALWRSQGVAAQEHHLLRASELYEKAHETGDLSCEGGEKEDIAACLDYCRVLQFQNRYEAAANIMLSIIANSEGDPEYSSYLLYAGDIFKSQGLYDQASQYFFEATTCGPPRLFSKLEMMFVISRNIEESSKDREEPCEDAYEMVYSHMIMEGEIPEHLSYDDWISDSQTWINLGHKCSAHGMYALARDFYSQSLLRDPNSFRRAKVWYLFAKSCNLCGLTSDAQLSVKQSLTIEPNNPQLRRALDSWSNATNDFSEQLEKGLPFIMNSLPARLDPFHHAASRLQAFARGTSERKSRAAGVGPRTDITKKMTARMGALLDCHTEAMLLGMHPVLIHVKADWAGKIRFITLSDPQTGVAAKVCLPSPFAPAMAQGHPRKLTLSVSCQTLRLSRSGFEIEESADPSSGEETAEDWDWAQDSRLGTATASTPYGMRLHSRGASRLMQRTSSSSGTNNASPVKDALKRPSSEHYANQFNGQQMLCFRFNDETTGEYVERRFFVVVKDRKAIQEMNRQWLARQKEERAETANVMSARSPRNEAENPLSPQPQVSPRLEVQDFEVLAGGDENEVNSFVHSLALEDVTIAAPIVSGLFKHPTARYISAFSSATASRGAVQRKSGELYLYRIYHLGPWTKIRVQYLENDRFLEFRLSRFHFDRTQNPRRLLRSLLGVIDSNGKIREYFHHGPNRSGTSSSGSLPQKLVVRFRDQLMLVNAAAVYNGVILKITAPSGAVIENTLPVLYLTRLVEKDDSREVPGLALEDDGLVVTPVLDAPLEASSLSEFADLMEEGNAVLPLESEASAFAFPEPTEPVPVEQREIQKEVETGQQGSMEESLPSREDQPSVAEPVQVPVKAIEVPVQTVGPVLVDATASERKVEVVDSPQPELIDDGGPATLLVAEAVTEVRKSPATALIASFIEEAMSRVQSRAATPAPVALPPVEVEEVIAVKMKDLPARTVTAEKEMVVAVPIELSVQRPSELVHQDSLSGATVTTVDDEDTVCSEEPIAELTASAKTAAVVTMRKDTVARLQDQIQVHKQTTAMKAVNFLEHERLRLEALEFLVNVGKEAILTSSQREAYRFLLSVVQKERERLASEEKSHDVTDTESVTSSVGDRSGRRSPAGKLQRASSEAALTGQKSSHPPLPRGRHTIVKQKSAKKGLSRPITPVQPEGDINAHPAATAAHAPSPLITVTPPEPEVIASPEPAKSPVKSPKRDEADVLPQQFDSICQTEEPSLAPAKSTEAVEYIDLNTIGGNWWDDEFSVEEDAMSAEEYSVEEDGKRMRKIIASLLPAEESYKPVTSTLTLKQRKELRHPLDIYSLPDEAFQSAEGLVMALTANDREYGEYIQRKRMAAALAREQEAFEKREAARMRKLVARQSDQSRARKGKKNRRRHEVEGVHELNSFSMLSSTLPMMQSSTISSVAPITLGDIKRPWRHPPASFVALREQQSLGNSKEEQQPTIPPVLAPLAVNVQYTHSMFVDSDKSLSVVSKGGLSPLRSSRLKSSSSGGVYLEGSSSLDNSKQRSSREKRMTKSLSSKEFSSRSMADSPSLNKPASASADDASLSRRDFNIMVAVGRDPICFLPENEETAAKLSSRKNTPEKRRPKTPKLELVPSNELCHDLLEVYKRRGYVQSEPGGNAFAVQWHTAIDNLLKLLPSTQLIRRAILSLQKAHSLPISRIESFCALAAVNGRVSEALGKIADQEFCMELVLVCKIVPVRHIAAVMEGLPEFLAEGKYVDNSSRSGTSSSRKKNKANELSAQITATGVTDRSVTEPAATTARSGASSKLGVVCPQDSRHSPIELPSAVLEAYNCQSPEISRAYTAQIEDGHYIRVHGMEASRLLPHLNMLQSSLAVRKRATEIQILHPDRISPNSFHASMFDGSAAENSASIPSGESYTANTTKLPDITVRRREDEGFDAEVDGFMRPSEASRDGSNNPQLQSHQHGKAGTPHSLGPRSPKNRVLTNSRNSTAESRTSTASKNNRIQPASIESIIDQLELPPMMVMSRRDAYLAMEDEVLARSEKEKFRRLSTREKYERKQLTDSLHEPSV